MGLTILGDVSGGGGGGGGGVVTRTGRFFLNLFGTAIDWGEGLCCAVDGSGNVYLAGTADFGTFTPGSFASSNFRWYIVRLTSGLVVDPTFGAGGVVTLDWGDQDQELTSIVLDANGKLVVSGIDYNILPSYKVRLARYNTDGTLDTTFGAWGVATVSSLQGDYYALSEAVLQSTGRILLMVADHRDASHAYVKVFRYYANGNLDTTFGTAGLADYSYSTDIKDTQPACLAVDASDRVYVSGLANAATSGTHLQWFIVRWTAAGAHDSSWASDTGNGEYAAILDFPQQKYAVAHGLQFESGTGKLLVCGTASTDATHTGVAVARFSTAGVLDSTFGASSGYTLRTSNLLGNDDGAFMQLDGSGRLMVGGQTTDATGNYFTPTTNFLLCRFTTAGLADNTFGTLGALSPAPNGDNRNDSVFYGRSLPVAVGTNMIAAGHVNSDTLHSVGCLVSMLASTGAPDTTLGDRASAAALTAPTATTSAASALTTTTATLNGSVTAQTGATTYFQFEYGLTAGLYPYRSAIPAGTTTSDGASHAVTAAITGLLSGATYHFRLVATSHYLDTVKVTYGNDLNFTTTAGGTNTIINATFTAPDGTVPAAYTPDTNNAGTFFQQTAGTISVQSNKLLFGADLQVFIDSGLAGVTVQCDFVWNGGASHELDLFVRYQNVSNYWMAQATGGAFKIVERVGGSNTTRATAAQTITQGVTYTIRAVISGTSITATINGGNSINYGSMASGGTNTKHGCQAYPAGGTVDNFSITSP